MGKRLMPGKTNKSKGKKYSHRPVRATNAIWDEKLRKWFRMPVLALMMLIPINAFADEITIEMLNKRDDGAKMVYSVDIARIDVGDTITWAPTTKGHNIEFKVGPDGWKVPKKSPFNRVVEMTFDTPGVYYYQCTPHKTMGMIGLVVVCLLYTSDAADE